MAVAGMGLVYLSLRWEMGSQKASRSATAGGALIFAGFLLLVWS